MTWPQHLGKDVDSTFVLNRRTGRTTDMVQSAVWHAMQGHNVVIVHQHYHQRDYAAHLLAQELHRVFHLGHRLMGYAPTRQFYVALETEGGSTWIQFTEVDRLDQWVRGRSPVEVFKDHTCYEHEHRKIRAMLKAA